MLELSRLRALDALAKHGTVHAAAASLNCTPSAISQQLAKLERETGSVLSEKDGRGLRLTDAGRLLAASAVAILDQVEQAQAALAAHHQTVSGRITIAAFATGCRALLPSALATLHAKHPQLSTSLIEVNPYEAIAGLARGAVDVALVDDWPEVGLQLHEGMSYEDLGFDTADLIVPESHRLARRASVTLDEARQERWIASPPGTICHDWLMRVAPGVTPDYLVGEFETQVTLIAAGLGIALIPRLARPEVPQGLAVVAVKPTPTRRVMVAWRTSSSSRPAVVAAIDALKSAWKEPTADLAASREGRSGPPRTSEMKL